MGFWDRFKTGNSGANGRTPDPPPAASPAEPHQATDVPSPAAPPAVPATEPRMATDLGDALTAYWRSGKWWGSAAFVKWLVDNGHMSEATYALHQIMKMPHIPNDVRRELLRQDKRLQALERRPQQQPPLPRSDAVAGEHPHRPSSASTPSGTVSEPADDLRS
jgi:hypothetical protein